LQYFLRHGGLAGSRPAGHADDNGLGHSEIIIGWGVALVNMVISVMYRVSSDKVTV
jgi:hypothetical protein